MRLPKLCSPHSSKRPESRNRTAIRYNERDLNMPLSPLVRRSLTVVVAFVLLNGMAYAQTTPAARQLLDSMIQALGGNQFLDVKEIQTSGRFFGFKREEVSQSDLFTDYIKFPDME